MRERAINLRDWEVRAILDGRKTMIRRPVKPQPDGVRDRVVLPGSGSKWAERELSRGRFVTAQYETDGSPLIGTAKGLHCHTSHACPFGAPGDLLWVRECWALVDFNACDGMDEDDFTWCTQPGDIAPGGHPVLYRATVPDFFEWNDDPESRWRSSIHMPRWASRLKLRVADVRVERVQDISEDDAIAEGARRFLGLAPSFTGSTDAQWSMFSPTTHGECLGSARMAFANGWNCAYAFGPSSWEANPWAWVVSFERAEVPR